MIQKNKWKLLLSSIVILLPVVFGLLVWDRLPEQMITHWGVDGNPNGMGGRTFAVFGLPLIILAVHWFCIFFTGKDPGNQEQNRKVFGLVIWITPVISLFACGLFYAVGLGMEPQPNLLICPLMGVFFIAIGNYLPKCKQNATIGIKIKWTLENEENWNATHRFGGKIWVIGGLFLLVCMFLPGLSAIWVMLGSVIALVAVPVVYSYGYHRKQVKNGTAVVTPLPKAMQQKKATTASLIGLAAALVFICVIMFTGETNVTFHEEAFTVEASFCSDLTVQYDAITDIEYREQNQPGYKINGFNSARLLLGGFYNEEFGNYVRYSYTRCDACVVIHIDDHILVLSGPDTESTKTIFETLQANLPA